MRGTGWTKLTNAQETVETQRQSTHPVVRSVESELSLVRGCQPGVTAIGFGVLGTVFGMAVDMKAASGRWADAGAGGGPSAEELKLNLGSTS